MLRALVFAVAGLLFVAPAVDQIVEDDAPVASAPTTTVSTPVETTSAPTTTAPMTRVQKEAIEVEKVWETTTTTLPPPPPYKDPAKTCDQWIPLAREVGWPEAELSKLSYVIWRESRCNIDSHYLGDPMSGSRGLTQINGFWCKKQRTWPDGWLTTNLGYEVTCEDLFDPRINLISALAIWKYSDAGNNNGWRPWSMPKN